jgi:hypothetical protein
MKFGNEFWLILFQEYINPKLFAVLGQLYGFESRHLSKTYKTGEISKAVANTL